MPVIKDPVLEAEHPPPGGGGDIVREVVVVPFSSNQTTYATKAETAEDEREARRGAMTARPVDPMEMARIAQSQATMPTSADLSEDVRDLITAARHAVGGADQGRAHRPPAAAERRALRRRSREPVFVPQWEAPSIGRGAKPTVATRSRASSA